MLPARAVGRRDVLLGMVGAAAAAALPLGSGSAWASPSAAPASTTGPAPAGPARLGPDIALQWIGTTYDLVLLENLSPPAAARAYACAAVAMYEAVVAGMPSHRSLAGSLTDLDRLPPALHLGQVDWPTALSTAVAGVLREVLPFRAPGTRPRLDTAEADAVAARRRAGVTDRSVRASVTHGRAVAAHLVRWIRADGHAGTVGRPYVPPVGESLWVSTPPNHRPAIEPYWSEVRPMVLHSAWEVEPEPPVPFSTVVGSPFHQQAMAPYLQSKANTDEHRAIAQFWTDNPGSFEPPLGRPTGLPSGHWMSIAAQTLAPRARLDLAVETLALTGIALHEAFLNCWAWKYHYSLLRPVTYINRYVDPTWVTTVNSPQFPEHTSGHSVASPAAAAVLTAQLGSVAFVDDTHAARSLPARRFSSFDDAAREAARSRLYGGIHFPHAIDAGLVQGRQVGALVLDRVRLRA